MKSYQLVIKQSSWYRNSFGKESGKLSLISVTKGRKLSKKEYKHFDIKVHWKPINNRLLIV